MSVFTSTNDWNITPFLNFNDQVLSVSQSWINPTLQPLCHDDHGLAFVIADNDYLETKACQRILAAAREELFSDVMLADRWNMSHRTLQGHRESGKGCPFVKMGRNVRYRLSDIIAFEAAGRRFNTVY